MAWVDKMAAQFARDITRGMMANQQISEHIGNRARALQKPVFEVIADDAYELAEAMERRCAVSHEFHGGLSSTIAVSTKKDVG